MLLKVFLKPFGFKVHRFYRYSLEKEKGQLKFSQNVNWGIQMKKDNCDKSKRADNSLCLRDC